MSIGVPSKRAPRTRRVVQGWVTGWNRVGSQAQFYFTTLGSVADAAVRYRVETLRLVAQMSLGTGALAVVGGTIGLGYVLTAIANEWFPRWTAGEPTISGWLGEWLNQWVLHPSNPQMIGNIAFVEQSGVCGNLCGSGDLVSLIKRNGKWTLLARRMTWIA